MNELLSVKEVAKLLGVPTSWVYDRVRVEAIPFFKIGKYVRFDPLEVKAWLEAQRKGPHLDISTGKSKLAMSTRDREEAHYG